MGLSTWRISSILHREEIFSFFRKWIGVDDSNPTTTIFPDTFIGRLFSCIWCLSVWVAIIMLVCYFVSFLRPLILLFAISTLAVLVEER